MLAPRQQAPGFALVATVSMMVLMTLIAVGMLSLSTIEQRSSGGGANEADRMARANARMALMIALGELQKAAGPDQRVTATASILGNANNTGYSMNGATRENIKDTAAVDGRKHWVGVVSAFYIVATGLLCMHLMHGVSSMFQSVGLRNKLWRKRLDNVALVYGWVVFLGFAVIPLASLTGILKKTGDAPAVEAVEVIVEQLQK